MSRFIRRAAIALPALLIAPVTAAAVALPAQAASAWSSALPLPFSVGSQGFAENASGMQVAASTTGAQGESSVVVAASATGLTGPRRSPSPPARTRPWPSPRAAAPSRRGRAGRLPHR